MRKAKIVCTIGPSSNSERVINGMVRAGMNVARLNFSHGTYDEHGKAVKLIRSASKKLDTPIATLLDLKGVKIRIGSIQNRSVHIKKGAQLVLTSKKVPGSSSEVQVQYPHLTKDLKRGDRVLIDDGLIRLRVLRIEKGSVITRVIEGGELKERKGVNFPGVRTSVPALTRQDRADILYGITLEVDYIALSFVRNGNDVRKVKRYIQKNGADIPVIAKIENREALNNIDDIVAASDGLMIARGDLGVEVPPEEVPLLQKQLIAKSNAALKPVITATQMLESMTEHLQPTRAEAADVANAVLDGTDALMLSAETTVGRYPVHTVHMMERIIRYTERNNASPFSPEFVSRNFPEAIAEAACVSSEDIGARTIVAFSKSGFTALLVSKFRPAASITGFTAREDICRRMNLFWGVSPHVLNFPDNTDQMIARSEEYLLKKNIVKQGDVLSIIATSPFTLGGKSNIMKLQKVGS